MRRAVILFLLVVIAVVAYVGLRKMGVIGGQPVYTTANGAIDGYDPVGYFTEGRAIEGAEAHTATWKGATWHFASAENRQAFEAEPEKYAPQYGGYCAYGMSEGYLAEVDPSAWTIVDGRLFLNFDQGIMERWRETKGRRIPLADENWARQ